MNLTLANLGLKKLALYEGARIYFVTLQDTLNAEVGDLKIYELLRTPKHSNVETHFSRTHAKQMADITHSHLSGTHTTCRRIRPIRDIQLQNTLEVRFRR
jgi:hypothetical protein